MPIPLGWIAVGAALLATAPPMQRRMPTDTLRLDSAVALARRANPGLTAMRLRADAAAARVPQAGAWMDPELSVGLMNRPLSGFGADEPMTMNQVQLRQMIPWPGKLGSRQRSMDAMARGSELDAAETEARLVARVTAVYAGLAATDRSLTILERTRDLLRDFLRVTEARYAVGDGLQQDVLQAQIAVAQVTEDLTVMRQGRIAAAARLNALLGRDATVPVAALELPPAGAPLPPVDTLLARATARRPALAAAAARVEAADAAYRAARRELYPDFMVSVGYGQRPAFDDMVSLMVGVTLPLWAGSRQLPARREADAMRAAEEAEHLNLANETFAELTELRAEAERARTLAELYVTSILPQARAAVEAALSAYRVGQVDYMTLVENEMTVNRYEIALVNLSAAWHRAVAGIEALTGPGGAR